jgi:hypothetical protein
MEGEVYRFPSLRGANGDEAIQSLETVIPSQPSHKMASAPDPGWIAASG